MTITGSGLTGTTAVQFGGVDAVTFTIDSDTTITATVPFDAVSGPITVVNAAHDDHEKHLADAYRTAVEATSDWFDALAPTAGADLRSRFN